MVWFITKGGMIFVFVTMLFTTMTGRGHAGPAQRVGADKELKRNQRSMEIGPNELKNTAYQRIEDLETEKKKCIDGEYWSFVVNECKSCERDCSNGTNINHCGNECKNYYKIKKLEENLRENTLEMGSKFERLLSQQKQESHQAVVISIIVYVGATIFLSIAVGVLYCRLWKKNKTIVRQPRADANYIPMNRNDNHRNQLPNTSTARPENGSFLQNMRNSLPCIRRQ